MIQSTSNPLIKKICQLRTKKGRTQQNRCMAEGIRTLSTLIAHEWQPEYLLVTDALHITAQQRFPGQKLTLVADNVMKKISTSTTPSGLLGVFPLPKKPAPSQLESGIVLARISDPGNMGTLIRSCAAFGYSSVVVIEGADPFAPKVIQASAGTIAQVNLFQWTWPELLKHKGMVQLIGLVPSGGTLPYDLSIPEGLLVIGSEAHGLPEEWINACQHLISIPMPGGTESLNAAVAGSIALYSLWFNNK